MVFWWVQSNLLLATDQLYLCSKVGFCMLHRELCVISLLKMVSVLALLYIGDLV